MSRSGSNQRKSAGQGPGRTSPPTTSARLIRSGSLLILLGVVFVVAAMMVVSLVGFVARPDPTVKAGPMYVTLALTTGAALIMLVLALNASFVPFMSPQRARDASLVMWVMGASGLVTGLLTLGGAVSPFLTRLVLGSVAYMFITVQDARLARARAEVRAGRAGTTAAPASPTARKSQARPAARQRRGGRKR
jgi:hypothetical protein